MDNLIICIYQLDEEHKYVMGVFNLEQWSMIGDICELTSQDVEEVVRGLGTSSPNTMMFDARDFNL